MNFRNYMTLTAIITWLAACGQGGPVDYGGVLGVPSGTYAVDKSHTYVTFSYFPQGLSYPFLRVTGIEGEIELDNS